jgi:uncharacterized protein (TIGR01777 family)
MSNTKIITLTGATGFVGSKLALALFKRGYQLRVLTRSIAKAKIALPLPAEFIEWNPESGPAPKSALEGSHALVHLAGEGIADGRWSARRKKAIRESRVLGTQNLVSSLNACSNGPKVFVSTSAIGLYGDRGSEPLTESSQGDDSFLSQVCQGWEQEALKATVARTVILRTGIVLGTDGGALAKMLLPFKIGAGGPLASGQQYMSWIHVDDHVNLHIEAIENDRYQGPINAVSPNPVTNIEFTKALGKAVGMPAFIPAPGFALKLAFGEMAVVILGSQNVQAQKLIDLGFQFKFAQLSDAFSDLLSPGGHKGAYSIKTFQWIQAPQDKTYKFFADAHNLERITPPFLNFKIHKMSTPAITQGTLIDYKLKVRGLPIRWRTLIESWQPTLQFVDTQLKGPYALWHHTHMFSEVKGGTLIEDRVIYRLPFWILGDLVRELWVKHDVRKIFGYRQQCIESLIR